MEDGNEIIEKEEEEKIKFKIESYELTIVVCIKNNEDFSRYGQTTLIINEDIYYMLVSKHWTDIPWLRKKIHNAFPEIKTNDKLVVTGYGIVMSLTNM